MRFRLTQISDFEQGRAMIPEAYRYSARVYDALPDIWSELLRDGRLMTALVEDPYPGSSGNVLALGLSIFVSDEFVDEYLEKPHPYLSHHVHDQILSGNSPVLDTVQIKAANVGDGLNLLLLHFCTPAIDFEKPEAFRALSLAKDLFRIMHGGYHIKRIVNEVVDEQLARVLESSGMVIHSDFAAQFPEYGLDELDDSEKPYLLVTDIHSVPPGSDIALSFVRTPVRFFFSPAEQKILQCALLRETDEEIALDVHLAPDTVRKHWKSIFHKVLNADPNFFACAEEGTQSSGTRGPGKRRMLLRYLQIHMEELRPYSPSSNL